MSSDKKKKRLLALEEKSVKKQVIPVSKKCRHSGTRGSKAPDRVISVSQAGSRSTEHASHTTSAKSEPASLMYAAFEEAVELFPWLQGDTRCLQDVVHNLLMTNPRYNKQGASNSSSIVDKMKEKTLLLENPVGQKANKGHSARRGMFRRSRGVRMASRKELDAIGCLNVKGMNVKYNDAVVLHKLWKEYRDDLLEVTASKQDMLDRIDSMDKHGALVDCTVFDGSARKQIRGIVISDTSASLHVVEPNNKVRVVPKDRSEVMVEVSQGRAALFCKDWARNNRAVNQSSKSVELT
jgi:hypothetical protein